MKKPTYAASNITGKVKVISRETIVEVVRGQTVDFLKRIEQDGGVITQTFLDEIHDVQSKKVEGPTAALAAVISLAATLATAGTTGPGVMAAMQAAAMGSLAGQAAVHLVACQGDIGKAAKRLASTETFINIATAVATAGITKALANKFVTAAPKTLPYNMQYQGLKTAVGGGMNFVAHGEISLDHLARGFAAGVIGAHFANEICEAYGAEYLDSIAHKVTHTALGAFTGAILDEKGDPLAEAAAGALGAFVAETFADMFGPSKPTMEKLSKKTHESGRPLTKDEFNAFYADEMNTYNAGVSRIQDFAKLTAATTALFSGQEVPIAINTATNAVDNNFIFLAMAGLTVATTAYEAYDIYQTYQNEGPQAALIKLGVDASLFIVGGMAVKGSSSTIRVAAAELLARNPALRIALGSFVDTMLVGAEKVMATNAGKNLAAALNRAEAPIKKVYAKGSEAFDRIKAKAGGKTKTPSPLTESEWTAKHSKKPVKQMDAKDFAQSLADRAEKAFGKGVGPRIGQKKHKYAEELGKRYQKMTGDKKHLEFEKSFKDNKPWQEGMGNADKVSPDVYNPKQGEVFDYKFGNAKLKPEQNNNYLNRMPKAEKTGKPVTVYEIKPNI